MTKPDQPRWIGVDTFHSRQVIEEVRARLSALSSSLSASRVDAAQLRQDATELGAVMHRMEWLADVGGFVADRPGPGPSVGADSLTSGVV